MWWISNSRDAMFNYVDEQHHYKFEKFDWMKCVSFYDLEKNILEPIELEWWEAFVEDAQSGH